MSIKELRY